MILIYTPRITKRVRYVFKLFFENLMGLKFDLTSKPDFFESYEGVKINYSKEQFDGLLSFYPAGLLCKTGIEGQDLNIFAYEDHKAFFPVYSERPALPFDPFAAAFFLVSRYEEYLPYRKDRFGRFDASESISFKHDFLHKPVVNIWAEKIKLLLIEKYPDIKFKKRRFRFSPTVDIDSAYAFKHKGIVRTLAATMRDVFQLNFVETAERFGVLTGRMKDPFDTFDFLLTLQKEFNLHPIFFILMADYGRYDKNLPVTGVHFQQLIKWLADYAEVGIHPSFDSNTKFNLLEREVERLSKILNREITQSRQHFLRLNFPVTYRNLIQADITDDYTMGYASMPGFRAGICDPYPFYDLDLETETMLMIHPFQIMDGALRDYMMKNIEESQEIIRSVIDEVKTVNGTFISLWHNESLSDQKRWKGWKNLYVEMVKYAAQQ
jgi:hypothetical protein